jgi:hypothetical protein
MELARWLRYVIPGALFEALVMGWLYTDNAIYDRYPGLPSIDVPLVTALSAASLPLGFVLSSVMHTMKWYNWLSFLIARMDDAKILEKSHSSLYKKKLKTEEYRGFLDAVLHLRFSDKQPVLNRARGLLDLANGQSTCLVAVLLSIVTIVVVLLVSDQASGHLIFSAGYLVACLGLAFLFWISQCRTVKITEQFLNGAFEGQ